MEADHPRLLVGAAAIAAHMRVTTRLAQHMINQRTIPTFRRNGTPMATVTALEEWSLLYRLGKI